MFGLSKLYGYLIAAAIVTAALALHLWGDHRTEKKLEATQTELVSTKHALQVATDNLLAVTKSQDEMKVQVETADKERELVRQELQTKLDAVKKAPAPQECKAAVNWVRKNKDLLK